MAAAIDYRNIRVEAWQSIPMRAIELHIIFQDHKGKSFVVDDDFTVSELVEGQIYRTPIITKRAAQELMDSLWSCGLRPTQGEGSAGAFDAVKYHLEDMRKIAFGALDRAAVVVNANN